MPSNSDAMPRSCTSRRASGQKLNSNACCALACSRACVSGLSMAMATLAAPTALTTESIGNHEDRTPIVRGITTECGTLASPSRAPACATGNADRSTWKQPSRRPIGNAVRAINCDAPLHIQKAPSRCARSRTTSEASERHEPSDSRKARSGTHLRAWARSVGPSFGTAARTSSIAAWP